MSDEERVRMSYDEMALFLGIPPRSSEREKIMAAVTPADWDAYEHMKWAEQEISAGRHLCEEDGELVLAQSGEIAKLRAEVQELQQYIRERRDADETGSDARDAARYRVVRVSRLTGELLAHELDAACDARIAVLVKHYNDTLSEKAQGITDG